MNEATAHGIRTAIQATHRELSLQPRRRRHSMYTSGAGLPAATSLALTTNSGWKRLRSPASNSNSQTMLESMRAARKIFGSCVNSITSVLEGPCLGHEWDQICELCCDAFVQRCCTFSDRIVLGFAPDICRLCRIFSGAPDDATPTPRPANCAHFTSSTTPGNALRVPKQAQIQVQGQGGFASAQICSVGHSSNMSFRARPVIAVLHAFSVRFAACSLLRLCAASHLMPCAVSSRNRRSFTGVTAAVTSTTSQPLSAMSDASDNNFPAEGARRMCMSHSIKRLTGQLPDGASNICSPTQAGSAHSLNRSL